MRVTDAALPTFARHETFHLRYGWLKKGYDRVVENPNVFNNPEATVLLGVGKNMVRSIRFWALATKILAEAPNPSRPRVPLIRPTLIGRALFGDRGWDPYLEDPATLWLLHWLLLAPPTLLPVWWLAFSDLTPLEFRAQDLASFCETRVESAPEWGSPQRSSILKDASVLLRTYARAEGSPRAGIEDLLDCPLRELALIRAGAAPGTFRFVIGSKPSLPPAVVGYAALDYVARTGWTGNTATLTKLSADPGSPGRIFKIPEKGLFDALTEVAQRSPGVSMTAAAGAPQFTWDEDPATAATDLLVAYYGSDPRLDRRPLAGLEAGLADDDDQPPLPSFDGHAPTDRLAALHWHSQREKAGLA
jgi:hypothetical protein